VQNQTKIIVSRANLGCCTPPRA